MVFAVGKPLRRLTGSVQSIAGSHELPGWRLPNSLKPPSRQPTVQARNIVPVDHADLEVSLFVSAPRIELISSGSPPAGVGRQRARPS